MYSIDTKKEVAVHMCGFERIQRGNYFGGEPVRRPEFGVRVGKLKNGKTAGKDEITGGIKKCGSDRGADCI